MMKARPYRVVLVSLICLTFLASGVGNAVQRADAAHSEAVAHNVEMEYLPGLSSSGVVSPAEKVSPALRSKLFPGEWVKVVVLTSDIYELRRGLEGVPFRGNIGNKNPDVKLLAAPIVELPVTAVSSVAALPSVIAVFEYEVPEMYRMTGSSVDISTPDAMAEIAAAYGLPPHNHRADRAWKAGYIGEGVNVAIIDTGIDFAHPELYGSQARLQDASSPYDGWPIVFDPASMSSYVRAVDKNESIEGLWYVNTTSTDLNITHSIKVDGKNDWWRIELVAFDPMGGESLTEPAMVEKENLTSFSDFELNDLYVGQDYEQWYFGFHTYANTSDVDYVLYIDTDQEYMAGAVLDPLENYVNATGWDDLKGSRNPANATHLPEFALVLRRTAPLTGGTESLTQFLYSWNNVSRTWSSEDLLSDSIKGQVGYSGYAHDASVGHFRGFMEAALPKAVLGDPAEISVILYTTSSNRSHAFDTVYLDPNVQFKYLDWSTSVTVLTAFTTVGWGFYSHFYNVDEWGPAYVVTPTRYDVPASFYKTIPHIGMHPDENMAQTAIIVVDPNTPGVYDTVYMDLDHDGSFANEKSVKKGDEIAYFDFFDSVNETRNFTSYDAGDGFPDISGGMLYFISDGVNLPPYMLTYLLRYGYISNTTDPDIAKYVPAPGEMIALTGDFDPFQSHGTLCASSVVGKGVTDRILSNVGKVVESRQVMGTAPGASLIPIANAYAGSIFDAWMFAVEGYDGNVSTLFDQAQIASNSFGWDSIYHDGWDIYSKFVDWVTMIYAEERTLFTVSAGNSGDGYGSVSAPSTGEAVVSVGASSDFSSRRPAGLENGPHYTYGDVVPFSSRGPSAIGTPEPDLLAVGRQAFGAVPLNQASVRDGVVASEIWMGTSLSSPTTAGVLALVYNAYASTHNGTFPSASFAKRLLISSADDMSHDVLLQGAGFLNAERAVDMATSTRGIEASVEGRNYWVPGDFRGTKYDAFLRLMYPGTADSVVLSLENHGASAVPVRISDSVFVKSGEYEFEELTPYPYNLNNPRANELWFMVPNPGAVPGLAHGVYSKDRSKKYAEGNVTLWERTAFVRITAFTDERNLDVNSDGAYEYRYWLDCYDWTDVDRDGMMLVTNFAEVNRLTAHHPVASTIMVHAREPAKKLHTGLGVSIRLFGDGNANITWKVRIEMFEKADWSWLSGSYPASLVPGTNNITLTLSVPTDAPPGSYEGAVYVEAAYQESESLGTTDVRIVPNEVLATTPTYLVQNLSIADATAVNYTTTLFNTTVHNISSHVNVANTGLRRVENESLIVTSSTPVSEVLADTTPIHVDNELLAQSGSRKVITNEYVGLVTSSDPFEMTLAKHRPEYQIVMDRVRIYLNGTPYTTDICPMTETLGTSYKHDRPLNLSKSNIVERSLELRVDGALQTEGINYNLDPKTGNLTFINMQVNMTNGSWINATYSFHTNYSIKDTGKIFFTFSPGVGKHVTADYVYYTYSRCEDTVLSRNDNSRARISPGSVTLYNNSIPMAEGEYEINYSSGDVRILTLVPPDTVITATYDYYFPAALDYSLAYGRDTWQELVSEYLNDSIDPTTLYLKQKIMPEKTIILGVELYVERNEQDTASDMEVSLLRSMINPLTEKEEFTVLAKVTKTRTQLEDGWNRFLFSNPITLNLTYTHHIGIKNGKHNIGYAPGSKYEGQWVNASKSKWNNESKWTGTTWTAIDGPLGFRTYNGYIAPGSPQITNNSLTLSDEIVNNTILLHQATVHSVYGERIDVQTDDWSEWYGIPAHSYVDKSFLVNGSWHLYSNGTELYENFTSPYTGDYYVYPNPYEDEGAEPGTYGLMRIFLNVSQEYVALDYQYYNALWDTNELDPFTGVSVPVQVPSGVRKAMLSYQFLLNGAPLSPADYTYNELEGELTLNFWLQPWDNLTMNYTSFKDYSLDMTTGAMTITNELPSGSVLTANYSYHEPYERPLQVHAGTTWAAMQSTAPTNIEDGTYSLYMDGKVLPPAGNYLLNVTTGTITLLRSLFANNTYTITYNWYYVRNTGNIPPINGTASDQVCVVDYTLYNSNYDNGTTPWPQSGNYSMENETGKVTFTNPLPPGTYVNATYKWYRYVSNFQLPHGSASAQKETRIVNGSVELRNYSAVIDPTGNYWVDNITGLLVFTEQVPPGGFYNISYQYYSVPWALLDKDFDGKEEWYPNSVKLPHGNLTWIELYDQGMPYTGYKAIDTIKGIIDWTWLPSGSNITASYRYYYPPERYYPQTNQFIPAEFQLEHPNPIGGSWAVYLNGTVLYQGVDYDYVAGDVLTPSKIRMRYKLPHDSTLNISYRYYEPLTGASLAFQYIDNLEIYLDTTLLVEGTDYTASSFRGEIEFQIPIPPGSSVRAHYNYTQVTTIPVLVNVPATSPNFELGSPSAHTQETLNNSMVYPGSGLGSGSGDWRFFYVDVPERGLFKGGGQNFMIDVEWEHRLTDIDAFVFGQIEQHVNPITKQSFPVERYGPIAMTNNGGSIETGAFYTTTDGPKELVAGTITPGLNIIALRTTRFSGIQSSEKLAGKIGLIRFSDTELVVHTNKLYGQRAVSLISDTEMNGITGLAAGPSTPVVTKETIYKDPWETWTEHDFVLWLTRGSFTRTINVDRSALIFDVHITSDHCPDLDLGIFLDGKDGNPIDGNAQVGEFIAYDADADADEEVKLIGPEPGTYIIKVLGFTVPGGVGTFNLAITLVQGEGFRVSGSTNETIPVFTRAELTVSWSLPGDTQEGKLLGALYVGTSDAPMFKLISIELVYDTTSPDVSGMTPAPDTVTSNRAPVILATFRDGIKGEIDGSSLVLTLDGIDVTSFSAVSAPLGKENDILGYWNGAITYIPPVPLSEGVHNVKAQAKDFAGNIAEAEWAFTVDTIAPSLTVTDPLTADTLYTTSPTYKIKGVVEPGSALDIYIGAVVVSHDISSDGTFTANLDLFTGLNEVRCTATDAAGHKTTVVRHIYLDIEDALILEARIEGASVTNHDIARLAGKVNKEGSIVINGKTVELMGDLTFASSHPIHEGLNTFEIAFTDLAGNEAQAWCNVTRDTIAPTIAIEPLAARVSTSTITITGSTEPDATLSINGKHIVLEDGEFSEDLTLSYGTNTIVVQSKDRAGNVAERRITLSYEPAWGVNYAAIGLMVGLLIIGLLIGALLIFFLRRPEAPPEEAVPEEAMPEEVPVAEEMPPIPPEEAIPEELPEISPKEGAEPIPLEETIPEEPEIPPEKPTESPEGIPPTETAPEAEEPPTTEIPEEEIPLTETAPAAEEVVPEEPKPMEETVRVKDTVLPKKAPPPSLNVDEKLARLEKAYNEGKISKEMYELNLRKLKGDESKRH